MARYAPLTFDTAGALPAARSTTDTAKPGLLRRIYDAIVEARMREAEREVIRFLATHQKFDDQLEREAMRRLTGYWPSGRYPQLGGWS